MLFVAAISETFYWTSHVEHAIAVVMYLAVALAFFVLASKLKLRRDAMFDIKKTASSLVLRAAWIYLLLILAGWVALLFAKALFKLP